jgi:hypothetical protein
LGRPKCSKRTATEGSKKTSDWIDIEDATVGMLFAEVPVLAVRLHAENKDLFDDYDRALAEAAFRISIMPPIVLILFSIPFQPAVSALWAVVCVIAGFVGFYALWTRAAAKVETPMTSSSRLLSWISSRRRCWAGSTPSRSARSGSVRRPANLARAVRRRTGAGTAASGPRAGRRCRPSRYRPSARLVSGECATIGVGDTRSHNNAEGIGE